MIQTYTPRNGVLLQASRQDYDAFYEAELPLRRLRGCPPFCDLIRIGFVGFPESHVERCAKQFAEGLWSRLSAQPFRDSVQDLLGPAPASILKINQKYRFQLTLCCKNNKPLRQLLSEELKLFSKQKETGGVSVYVDINGYE